MADLTAPKISPSASAADPLNRAADAALRLAREGEWSALTLRDIAAAAGVPLAELYASAPDKASLVDHLSGRFDAAALNADLETAGEAGDRLFEAIMARLEVMEPERFALIAMLRAEGHLSARMGLRLAVTAKSLLEAAGVDTGGSGGAVRVAAMTAVWIRILRVWRDDEGALNRTMAEIDTRLKQMRRRLGVVGLGF